MLPSPDADLPRLLCLHGGGVTAQVFRRQCRSLIQAFSPYFRLVFADAPFPSAAGPGISTVYGRHGPFRRWLRWLPEHPAVDDREAAEEIERSMRRAMEADDAAGGRGEWVGLLGFSQGGKVAASILFDTQVRIEEAKRTPGGAETAGFGGGNWRFAVLLASRAPLVALSDFTYNLAALEMPGALCSPPVPGQLSANQNRLSMPTVHVHGLKDPGLRFHRAMLADFTFRGSTEVMEWSGDHRVPIKSEDVNRVVQATLKAAKKAAVFHFC